MSSFFPESKEDFEKNMKNIEDFVRIQVTHQLLRVGPEDSLVVECDKCRHRKIVQIGKMMGIEGVVGTIMKWVKDSEIARYTLLAEMLDAIKKEQP